MRIKLIVIAGPVSDQRNIHTCLRNSICHVPRVIINIHYKHVFICSMETDRGNTFPTPAFRNSIQTIGKSKVWSQLYTAWLGVGVGGGT